MAKNATHVEAKRSGSADPTHRAEMNIGRVLCGQICSSLEATNSSWKGVEVGSMTKRSGVVFLPDTH